MKIVRVHQYVSGHMSVATPSAFARPGVPPKPLLTLRTAALFLVVKEQDNYPLSVDHG
jgi:hypothetical protein